MKVSKDEERPCLEETVDLALLLKFSFLGHVTKSAKEEFGTRRPLSGQTQLLPVDLAGITGPRSITDHLSVWKCMY